MDIIEEQKKQVEEEMTNNKKNKQFLMIKDIYCKNGLNLNPSLACFYSFLIFMSDRFLHNNKGTRAFIGYSNKSLANLYSDKWFYISERSVVKYLLELKNKDLISIENNGKANRKIYINYAKIRPELLNMLEDEILQEYKDQIKSLSEEIEELKRQNDLLSKKIVNQNTDEVEDIKGLFVKILYDRKYLTKKDKLVRSQLEDYNAMLKSYLFLYEKEGLDLLVSINYICARAEKTKIHDKFSYLYTSLSNYLNQVKNNPDELYPDD